MSLPVRVPTNSTVRSSISFATMRWMLVPSSQFVKIRFGKISSVDAWAVLTGLLLVSVVGAIDKDELGRILDEVFDALPIKSDLADVAEIVPAAATQVDIPMAIPQAVIRFAGKGLKRSDRSACWIAVS